MPDQPAIDKARAAAEHAARASYGRLVAMLASRSRDIAAAEDALADSFAVALRQWPVSGVPERPEAWLLTAARRTLGHYYRHAQVRDAAQDDIAMLMEEAHMRAHSDPDGFPDRRVALLFACAHPAIDPHIRTPLMLQTVLGLDAARIAAAFVVSPATMSQRLVRAKAKIRDSGIAFAVPDSDALPDRTGHVLAAIYAAYGTGWDGIAQVGSDALNAEAMFLGQMVVDLLPNAPEAKGLRALMLYCEARRHTRRDASGAYVPLDRQDARAWDRAMITAAEKLLRDAGRAGTPGRFQIEAAIQSFHIQRAVKPDLPLTMLAGLYDLLVRIAPSLGGEVGRAAAYGAAFGPEAGLQQLDALPADRMARYQPYWATRLALLRQAGRASEARAALASALMLTSDPAVRALLTG